MLITSDDRPVANLREECSPAPLGVTLERKRNRVAGGLGAARQNQAVKDLAAVGESPQQKSPCAICNPCTTLWTNSKRRIRDFCLHPCSQGTRVMTKRHVLIANFSTQLSAYTCMNQKILTLLHTFIYEHPARAYEIAL